MSIENISELPNKTYLDFTSIEKKNEIQAEVRKAVFSAIENVLREHFTEAEFIKDNAEMGVVVGQALNGEFTSDVFAVVKVECKNWYDGIGAKGRIIRPFREDYDEMRENLEFEREQKAIKKAKRESK